MMWGSAPQNMSAHGTSALLKPAKNYAVTLTHDLCTWDSYLPWDSGETWWICQGYNNPTITHRGQNKYGLDLVRQQSDVGPTGCNDGADTSTDEEVMAPANGGIARIGTRNPDIVCLDTLDGYSLKIGHFTPVTALQSGTSVNKGNH